MRNHENAHLGAGLSCAHLWVYHVRQTRTYSYVVRNRNDWVSRTKSVRLWGFVWKAYEGQMSVVKPNPDVAGGQMSLSSCGKYANVKPCGWRFAKPTKQNAAPAAGSATQKIKPYQLVGDVEGICACNGVRKQPLKWLKLNKNLTFFRIRAVLPFKRMGVILSWLTVLRQFVCERQLAKSKIALSETAHLTMVDSAF